jgi:hypothetical protein
MPSAVASKAMSSWSRVSLRKSWRVWKQTVRALLTRQEVIANGHLPKLRGLQVFRFSGVIRTVGHMLRRALQFVLDFTSPLGKPPLTKT